MVAPMHDDPVYALDDLLKSVQRRGDPGRAAITTEKHNGGINPRVGIEGRSDIDHRLQVVGLAWHRRR